MEPAIPQWILGPSLDTQASVPYLKGSFVVIGNPTHWMQNEAELEADLLELGGERQGMILSFPDPETRMIWVLRWS